MMNIGNGAGLGPGMHWVQNALIITYEDNCPLRPVKTCSGFLKWTAELESIRRDYEMTL
jgi:hypothetical protein